MVGYLAVNNIAIDPKDNPKANYLIVQSGEPFEESLSPDITDFYYIDCNKTVGFSCLEALHLDGKTL